MNFEKILEAFGAGSKVAAPIAIFTTALLLFHSYQSELSIALDIAPIVSKYKGWLYLISSASWIILFVNFVRWVWGKARGKWQKHVEENNYKSLLTSLSKNEKEFLKGYIEHETATKRDDVRSGLAGGLASKGILFRSSSIGYGMEFDFPYTIQPWALELLRKHPKYLA